MRFNGLSIVLSLLLLPALAQANDEAEMAVLVSPVWLSEHLDEPDLVVLDCSVMVTQSETGAMLNLSGQSNYDAGHIPSAGFADLMGDLSDPDASLELTAPAPEVFAEIMGRLGVGDDTKVVLYDTYNSAWAARVWWMLRWVGFDRVAILDGGYRAWQAEGRPVSTEPANEPARTLTPAPREDLFADRDEVVAAISDAGIRIIDSLPSAHYSGEMAMYARPGHITSAENRSVMLLTDETGRFRPAAELNQMFTGNREQRAITYCGGGIAASSVAFTMHRLGFRDVRVYDGSLDEWAADPANPMAVSPDFDWSED